ncbi:DNA polymerase family A-domain-containing protein [Pisolithus microcarpus]|nr:DNA polymerase family A-domain-containing protein [Pisolithus microcarpus]
MLSALRRTLACGQAGRAHVTSKTPTLVPEYKQSSNTAVPQTPAAPDGKRKKRRRDTPPQPAKHAERNPLGVQLLSRQLHAQIFRNVSFPSPKPSFVQISREHLEMHGLDPKQGSVLPDIGFTLPPLQGSTIDEHFYRVGSRASQPWLSLAKDLAACELPPRPDYWDIRSGWTKYNFLPDGSSYSEYVEYPQHDGKPEEILVFDVETMPSYHPYAVIACAASKNAWYAWISPWLLGESSDVEHLVPLGPPDIPRVVVGHNVSYDRQRILEEYTLGGTQTRFLDTMALHVAVKGISSHQRPVWMKHRKSKAEKHERREEAVEMVVGMLQNVEVQFEREADEGRRAELCRLRSELEEGLSQLQSEDFNMDVEESKRTWEDLTSANSLADVAKLHCNIDVDKGIREDFVKASSSDILEHIHDFLNYCANDVYVTHRVFLRVLPSFLQLCPSPVSFAGILAMGSSFLTVNDSWETYLNNAERTYHDLEAKVKKRLIDLAEGAKSMMEDGSWKESPWLGQLDWTPKVAGKSRGVIAGHQVVDSKPESKPKVTQPAWFRELVKKGPLHPSVINRMLPLLLKMSFDGHPLRFTIEEKWHYVKDGVLFRLPTAGKKKTITILSTTHGLPNLNSGRLSASDRPMVYDISCGKDDPRLAERVLALARSLVDVQNYEDDPSLCQLDWSPVDGAPMSSDSILPLTLPSGKDRQLNVLWPKWFWDLARPKKGMPPGSLDITVRNRIVPILLQLSWLGWPLFYSREHGWTFRVRKDAQFSTRLSSLDFFDRADHALMEMSQGDYVFFKLPHKDGDKANVGSPLGKTFMKYALDGTLTSPGGEANDALDMNAQCSYWISARDRILNQMDEADSLGPPRKWGMILPQVITMGTVTRRAIEKTWLTASNAKKNRVGSELKAMVRAPKGYAIVGADVDSEELWISSCMGDAQFGLHGATALGWMTLEGTKAAGTDLHSKTASILGISRDQAKVFNYSRIYGAGMRHAVLLLLQSNASMHPDQAQKLAENLYATTKGKNTHRPDLFGRKFWYGGTESFVFNKLEEIALSDRPQTPALGCGVTAALSKENLPEEFGADFMTSRINWVVQSSGVDYLHLLIVAMNYLTSEYDIAARYLISVHDELRYLVTEEDRYRAALALQIANLWTRSLFAFRLGMDDLPQSVAFFSAVDIDHVLRKEVDMPCERCLNIADLLEKTHGGSLWKDGRAMAVEDASPFTGDLAGYHPPNCLTHRANGPAFLRAQATNELAEVKHLAHRAGQITASNRVGISKKGIGKRRSRPQETIPLVDNIDWDAVREVLRARSGS